MKPRALITSFAPELLLPAVAVVVALAIWELTARIAEMPVYLLPPPSAVLKELGNDPAFYLHHGWATLTGALGGWLLGGAVALVASAFMAHWLFLERSLLPLAVLVKVTPIIAIAPLLTLWFGFTMLPKVVIAALIVFFPVLINGVAGFRSASPGALDFLRSLNASQWEVFLKLRLPSALPYLFSTLKVSLPLCLVGAVVAEWMGSWQGLGMVILQANNSLDTTALFAAILVLAFMGVAMVALATLAERRWIAWHQSPSGSP